MSAFGHTHLEFIFHGGTKAKYYLDSLSESKQCARKKKWNSEDTGGIKFKV